MYRVAFLALNSNHLDIFDAIIERLKNRIDVKTFLYYLNEEDGTHKRRLAYDKIEWLPLDPELNKSGIGLSKYVKFNKCMRSFEKKIDKKNLLVLGSDFNSYARGCVHVANNKNIPSFLLQDGHIESKFSKFDMDYEEVTRHKISVSLRLLLILVFKAFQKEYFLAGRYGTSKVSKIFVWGIKYRDCLHSVGVPFDKIEVSGSPRHDRLFNGSITDHRFKRSLNRFLIVTSAPSSAVLNYQNWTDQEVLDIIHALKRVNNRFRITIKIHPRLENLSHYKKLLENNHLHSVKIIQNGDLFSLLKKNDMVVNSFSTVGIEAMAFRKPTIFTFINFPPKRYRYFINEYGSDLLSVDSIDGFQNMVCRLRQEDKFSMDLSLKYDHIGSLFFSGNTGKSSERIVENIVHVLSDIRSTRMYHG